jgi:branched-chain amino acid transport system substrate-binding protein
MDNILNAMITTSLLVALVFSTVAATADPILRPADAEIRIGNIMPYTGPLASFATIGRTEAAYFKMIDDRGGIDGRKIRFLSRDDGSDPKKALEETRRLVENDGVSFIFGSFGTPGNLAARPYLNERKIPQLFLASGDEEWDRPVTFPWTTGWQPSFRVEGRIYANYVEATYPDRKIAVLWQNDQFGLDLLKGLQEGLDDWAQKIVSDTTFNISDKSIERQIELLRASGAGILLFDGSPSIAAHAIRRMSAIGWHPIILLDNKSASIANALKPAGLQNSIGVISTTFLKSATDPAWKDDEGIKRFSAFMAKYYPDGNKEDSNTLFGYAAAETLLQVLKQCGDDLSRDDIMRQALSLKNFQSSVVLPGISINTGPKDRRPIKQLRLVQFDGSTSQPIGAVFDSAFVGYVSY